MLGGTDGTDGRTSRLSSPVSDASLQLRLQMVGPRAIQLAIRVALAGLIKGCLRVTPPGLRLARHVLVVVPS